MKHEIRVLGELGSEFERIALKHRRRGLLGGPRWRPLALIAVLVLGGTTAALAAAGVFQSGAPYGAVGYPLEANAGNGVATSGSVHLVAISVPDPAGGPAWGIRIDRTTRGLVCIAVGRRDYGTVGAVGIDGAFHDDHLFHPLSLTSQVPSTSCASTDPNGNAFMNVVEQTVSVSGLRAACRSGSISELRREFPAAGPFFSTFAAHYESLPPCDFAQLRDLYYGLLGPDAVSVSYPGPHGRTLTERTVGSDGAYLVVAPGTEQICTRLAGPFGGTSCGIDASSGPSAGMPAGFFDKVTYRNGKVCQVDQLVAEQQRAFAAYKRELRERFPLIAALQARAHLTTQQIAQARRIVRSAAFVRFARAYLRPLRNAPACPVIGQSPTRSVHITAAQVATPIKVTVGNVNPDCATVHGHRRCGFTEVDVTVSFKARIAITDVNSHYEVTAREEATSTRCKYGGGGTSAPTETDLRAGQTVTMPLELNDCPGIVHGDVVFNTRDNTAYKPSQPVRGGLPAPDGIVVGTFTARIP